MRHAKRQGRAGAAAARTKERGAALVTMLLTSTLLLAAGGALMVTTSMGAGTASDSTSEMQAYYVAESGLQSALNVLRGHTRPLATSGLDAATEKITFRTAVVPNKSNGSTSTAAPFTLGAWLPYNNTGNVPVSLQVGALTVTGGYRVTVEDPDSSHIVTFATSSSTGAGATPLGAGLTQLNVSYTPGGTTLQPANLNAHPYSFNTNFGQFVIQRPSGSTGLVLPGTKMSFMLTINQTAPWSGAVQFEGELTVVSALLIRLSFKNPTTKKADGTTYRVSASTFDLAYPAANTTATLQITANVVAPEPKRILARSIGLGPRQSRKQLEMLLTRSNFEFEAPSTLTVQGPGDCSGMTLDTGNSNAKDYTGHDRDSGDPPRPSIAVPPCNVDDAEAGIKKPGTISDPQIGVLGNGTAASSLTTQPVGTPSFLETADAARSYLNGLEALARGQGRYFKPAAGDSRTVNDGTPTNPVLTFVDGNCELSGGAGILVVTGALNMSGNPSFDGIVLVLGQGTVNRNGGGNGTFSGAMVIASFARTWPASENNQPHPFLAPSFNTNGGGNSTMQYSSTAVARAFAALGSSVGGVREF